MITCQTCGQMRPTEEGERIDAPLCQCEKRGFTLRQLHGAQQVWNKMTYEWEHGPGSWHPDPLVRHERERAALIGHCGH